MKLAEIVKKNMLKENDDPDMNDLEILREKALMSYQRLIDAWESKWKPKILKLVEEKYPDYDGENIWDEILDDRHEE